MFRKMHKIKQQLTEQETKDILTAGSFGVLGVNGDDGYPYTVPVNYVYEGDKIFLHCAKKGYKLDAIRQSGKVSFCVIEKAEIDAPKLTTHFRSAILFGKARILEKEEEICSAAERLGLKYSSDIANIRQAIKSDLHALNIIEITIEYMTGKRSE